MSMIKLLYGSIVVADACDYYDVYMIDIDENRIELNDINGMVIGCIDHNSIYDRVEIIKYDKNKHITNNSIILCEYGDNELILKNYLNDNITYNL